MSAQNIEDFLDFLTKYSEFSRAVQGAEGASEWPELRKMLPSDMANMKVLDLACDEGWFRRWSVYNGTVAVDTCDIGVNLLNKAEDRTLTAKLNADKDSLTRSPVVGNVDQITYDQINYFRIDIEKLAVEKRAYGLVFCGLALHYVKNLKNVIDQVHSSLMPGGIFVFSIEHPFLTTPKNPNGFTKSVDGETDQWPVDSYFDEGERKITWLVQGVKIQHRTLSSYLALLTGAGFEVVKMDEWGITEHKTRKYPDGVEGVISRILLMTAKKQA